ncbi:MAG: hypothetical protein KGR69_01140 [Verrucomicrobia bacterium]|jgi:hypothetical protein|nr:hypothetical protein [Verrucomicrobiota bacterium]
MKKAILVATIGALTLGVNAGDWGKAPVDKTPVEECVDLGGNISAGYHTDFIFRGVRWARDTVSADVNYTTDALPVPVTVGASYYNGINGDGILFGSFDMLHLYTDIALGTFAGFDVSLGYTHYTFPEFRSNVSPSGFGFGEVGLDISRSLGIFDVTYSNAYAMGGIANGWFHQLGAERSFGLTDNVSLVLGAGIAYSDSYWEDISNNDSNWNNYYFRASLPIQLNCRTVLAPYVGYTGNGGAAGDWVTSGVNPLGDGAQSDILHGGVTLSVSF